MTWSRISFGYRRCPTAAAALAAVVMLSAPPIFAQEQLGPEYEGWGLSGGETLRYFASPSPQACRSDCESNAQCQAYTWVKPGGYQPGDGPVCYLMRSYGGSSQHSCCISGTRGPFPGQ